MGRIVHRDHPFPVLGPTSHVLGVGRGHVLDFSKFPLEVEFFEEQEFTAVDDGFGHHVLQAGFCNRLADLVALFDCRRHRHGAHDMLTGAEGFEAHPSVVGDGRVDVDEVDGGVFEDLFVGGESVRDPELVGDFVKFLFVPAANGDDFGVRVTLVDGDKLCPEAQTDHRHSFFVGHTNKPLMERKMRNPLRRLSMGETILIVSKFGRICHGKLRKKPKLFSLPNRLGCHRPVETVNHGIITTRADPGRIPRNPIVTPS